MHHLTDDDADRLRRQRRALADFGLHAFQSDDLDGLLHGATQLVSEAMGVDLVKVLEHHPDRREMLLRAGTGWKPGVVGHATMGDDGASPGGYALTVSEAVVSCDVDQEDRFEIPLLLRDHGVRSMVNVIIPGEPRPYGVLEVDARVIRTYSDDDVAFLQTYANLLAAAINRIRSHEELQRKSRDNQIMALELVHRVKNLLALVQAIVAQTTTRERTALEYQQMLSGRLAALAHAESLLLRDGTERADLGETAVAVLSPYLAARSDRVAIFGPPVMLSARQGRLVGLALHELATNASKHGALTVEGGGAELSWQLDETDWLHLVWKEHGGPEAKSPVQTGFGTRLLRDVMEGELEGHARFDYGPDGFTYRLKFPLVREG